MKPGTPESRTRKQADGQEPTVAQLRWGRFLFPRLVALVVLLAGVTAPGQGERDEPERPFRFAFSTALMPEVNENDSRAAMKVWAETMIKSGAVRADPNVLLTHDLATLADALCHGNADGVAVSTTEYLALREQVKFNHHVFAVIDGSIFDEYVLLVHQDGGLTQVEDLQGRSLQVLRTSRTCLAVPWLDMLLVQKGLKPTRDWLGRVTEEQKITKAVLPVFFHKSDACLVTRKGYKTMVELNPQVSQRLRVLATSPALVATGFFFRAGFPQAQQDACLAEFTRVHTTPSGQQILTVFQTERLEEHPASVLASAIALAEAHRRLCGEKDTAKPTPTRGTFEDAKGVTK